MTIELMHRRLLKKKGTDRKNVFTHGRIPGRAVAGRN